MSFTKKIQNYPSMIELWFQDDVVVSSSFIKLTNREGTEIPLRATQVDPKDSQHVIINQSIPYVPSL